ncbi:MAG TPA: hypothetical protein IAA20_02380 [Candidatus Enterococcus avicola]|uniref:Uncharacterized protein n=1 Tax=Candidatus Enterococcus avicola TaxID=2838561 RepID=A0A9D2F667_9ENTE|nr:hypothetical protein [Weissella thailandensis]HIZ52773.1 hypothetical protein [Candidatus Enterococcus avicola]HJA22850.1 hypothetical protein [Candidatus Limosilactobacillus intestinavium]
MMRAKDIKPFRKSLVSGLLAFPRALQNIALLIKKPNHLPDDKYLDSILKGSDTQRIESDFVEVGNDMYKALRKYDNKYARR